jgi:hypothetical protein
MTRANRSTIDKHPDRARIEREIAIGKPCEAIAKKFSVSKDAVWRHRKKLPPQLKAALAGQTLRAEVDLEKLRIDESESLLANLAAQRAKLLLAQDNAIEADQWTVLATLSAQIHRNLELVGKYLGEFAQHQVTTRVSILIQPEYLALRAALVQALLPFPDARRAVAAVLHKTEGAASSPPTIEAARAA